MPSCNHQPFREAKHQCFFDYLFFKLLDRGFTWHLAWLQLSDSSRPVHRFRPGLVVAVEAVDSNFAAGSGEFWRPGSCKKNAKKTPGDEDPADVAAPEGEAAGGDDPEASSSEASHESSSSSDCSEVKESSDDEATMGRLASGRLGFQATRYFLCGLGKTFLNQSPNRHRYNS